MMNPPPAPARSYLAGCVMVVLAGLLLSRGVVFIRGASARDAWQYLFWRSVAFGLALSILGRSVAARVPMAEIRRLGAFAGISVLAMVHPVGEHCRGLLSHVIGTPGGGYAGLAVGAGSGWMKEGFELLGVPFEDRGRSGRRLFTGTSADAVTSLGMGHVTRKVSASNCHH